MTGAGETFSGVTSASRQYLYMSAKGGTICADMSLFWINWTITHSQPLSRWTEFDETLASNFDLDRFTSRISVCSLFSAALPKARPSARLAQKTFIHSDFKRIQMSKCSKIGLFNLTESYVCRSGRQRSKSCWKSTIRHGQSFVCWISPRRREDSKAQVPVLILPRSWHQSNLLELQRSVSNSHNRS